MTCRPWIVFVIAALSAPLRAGAQPVDPAPVHDDGDPEDRYQDETLIKQNAKKAKRGKGWIPRISGYVQVFYKKRFDTNHMDGVEPSLFRIHRVRVAISGKVIPKVRYRVEIDPRAPEITGVLRDAYVELRYVPYHKLRIGQQKTPWGYENGESSSRLYTATRTELAEGIGRGVTLRDIGVAIKGRVPLTGAWSLEDHLALVNGAGMNVQVDDTAKKDLWGRVGVRFQLPDREISVRAGVSFGIGDYAQPEEIGPPPVPASIVSFKRAGADVQVDSRYAFVVAEAAFSRDRTSLAPDDPDDILAWYVLAAGKTPWNAGPVVRYDVQDADGFARWTFGAYGGAIDAKLRAMATYEIFEDDAGKHDHRLLLWTQARI